MKFIDCDGIFLDHKKFSNLEKAFSEIEIKTNNNNYIKSQELSKESIDEHLDNILNLSIIDANSIRKNKIKVVVDCVNGATSKAIPLLLEKLHCEITKIHSNFNEQFGRSPEPIPSNLDDLSNSVIKNRAEIGLATDPDGDRLSIVDNTGNPIGEEMTLGLCVYYYLKYFPDKRGHPIVTNLSTSLLSEEIAKQYKTKFLRTPVGEINVVKKMQEVDALIGGEGNGGIILKESHLGRDSLVGSAIILNLLINENKNLNEILESLPKYYIQKSSIELNNSSNDVLNKIKEKFCNEELIDIDGLKIVRPDEWIHVRKSNTEPILRIISESKSVTRSNELVKEIKELI